MNNREGRPRAYVGVSGIVNRPYVQPSGLVVHEPQQLFVEGYATNAGLFETTDRLLALGVKATHKTQFLSQENKYGRDWFPVGSEFTYAMRPDRPHPNTLAVAQIYMDKDAVHDSEYRKEFMDIVYLRGKRWLQAVQFDLLPWHQNMPWDAHDTMLRFVEDVREKYGLQTLLQCYEGAMTDLGPKGVVRKLGEHAAGLDYILFDASHGTGKRLDVDALSPFLEEAYSSQKLSHVGISIAGGLDAQTVREELPILLEKYPDLSCDAEGNLHPLNNMGTRPLQMDRVKDYLRASAEVLAN